jgi:hypothetical protein
MIGMKPLATLLGILAMVAPVFAQNSPEKISLRWNVKPDDRFEYRVKVGINSATAGKLNMTIYMADRIKKVSENEIESSVYIAGASGTAEGLMDQLLTSFLDMKNLDFSKTVKPTGKATSVAGSSLGNGVDLIFPTVPVGVGDTWNDMFTMENIGEFQLTYSLRSFTTDEATIEATVKKTETVDFIKPYVFVVDRKSGRYKSATGEVKVSAMGFDINATFNLQMLYPSHTIKTGN